MPSSLPNWHPFLVHFPVALYVSALGCDVALLARFRVAWLDRTATLLYAVAAIGSGAAAISGKLAADGMAETLPPATLDAVALHGDWAFVSVVSMFVVAAMRFDSVWRDRVIGAPSLHRMRVATLVASALVCALLLTTAARGGELVYRYGVAVQDHGIISPRR